MQLELEISALAPLVQIRVEESVIGAIQEFLAIQARRSGGAIGGTFDGSLGAFESAVPVASGSFGARIEAAWAEEVDQVHCRDVAQEYFDDDDGAYEGNINALANAGITLGCGEWVYCPDAAVARDQMASFLARAFLDATT